MGLHLFGNKFLYLIIALVLCCVGRAYADVGSDYVPLIRSAVEKVSEGLTREAFEFAAQALDLDPDDPLAHTLLGYTYAVAGNPKGAEKHYNLALKQDPNCAQAAYGLAILELNTGKPEDALVSLTNAQSLNPDLNMRGALEYAKYLCTHNVKDFSGIDPLSKLVQAHGIAASGEHKKALAALEDLLAESGEYPYKERLGLSATFDPEKPVASRGWPLRKTDALKSLKERNIQLAQGTLTLKIDMQRAGNIRMVSFMVDGKLACFTNQAPFQFVWDTVRYPDGMHVVTIQGSDQSAALLSSKTTNILVRNLPSGSAASIDQAAYKTAWQELWKAMDIKPSNCEINYQIALSALEIEDKERAQGALENVLSINPDFKDARKRLIELRGGPREDVKIYKSQDARKKIALTFDDGPGESVPVVLEILKTYDIKATFFLVGKQVELHPDILKAIHEQGHEIQNHTFNHSALSFLKETEIEIEYFSTSSAIRNIIGIGTSSIRPPGGREGSELYRFLRKYGVDVVLWTVNGIDNEGANPEKLAKQVTQQVRPGAIVLLHHGSVITQRALPQIIETLHAQKYEFVKTSDFLAK